MNDDYKSRFTMPWLKSQHKYIAFIEPKTPSNEGVYDRTKHVLTKKYIRENDV